MKNGMHVDTYGTKRGYKNGKLHREDGPAFEGVDGSKWWCLNGKSHREDGPAIIWADGTKAWWLDDKWHPLFDEWLKELDVSDEDKLFLKLKWV